MACQNPICKLTSMASAAARLICGAGTEPSARSRSTSLARVTATTLPRKKSPLSSSDLQ